MDTAAYVFGEELQWLQRVLQFRNGDRTGLLRLQPQLAPPALPKGIDIGYGALCTDLDLDLENRLLLILSLAPVIAPQFLDREIAFWTRGFGPNQNSEVQALWGLVYGQMYRGILPTAMLYTYLLAGDDFAGRFEVQRKISFQQYKIMDEGIVLLSDAPACEPRLCGIFSVEENYSRSLLL
jgi:hypothetical protein